MQKFCAFFLALLLTSFANAQYKEANIKAVVDSFFRGMKNADTTLMKATLAPNVVFETVAKVKVNETQARNEVSQQKVESFILVISKQKPNDFDERITYETIKIDDGLAVAWTPYKFFYKGKFSHCGINMFTLVYLNGAWRIQRIIDTRRVVGCKEKV
jgi:Putative lumazine-binding